MKRFLEKLSLLALSSMLISTYSISSALPYMLETYKDRRPESVELLISIPSFMIMAVLLSNRFITRYLTERQIIILGFLFIGIAGMAPVWIQAYPFMVVSRLLLGLGVGLLNAKAISIISEHFEGKERIQMLGYRGSAEVVGSSFLTVLVGFFLKIDWPFAFAIYAFAFLSLLLYLLFVPNVAEQKQEFSQKEQATVVLSVGQKKQAAFYAFLAGMTVFVNTVVSMRTPLMITEMALGTASQASYILSLQQLIGVLSGILFAFLLKNVGKGLGGLSYVGLGLSYLLMGLSHSFLPLAIGAILSGFFYSLVMTVVFYDIADRTPSFLVNAATAIVLLGCNLGSAFSPYILKVLGLFLTTNSQIFLLLALLMSALGTILFFQSSVKKRR